MRVVLLLASVLFFAVAAGAQILEPVKWDFSNRALGNDEFELILTARLDAGWSIYSQFTSDEGPVPTTFSFTEGSHYSRLGAVKEMGEKKEGPDPLFGGVTVIKFPHGPVKFVQRVKVTNYSQPIEGYLEFMTCDDERCLPPTEVEFSFRLSPAAPAPAGANEGKGAQPAPAGGSQPDPAAGTPSPTGASLQATEPPQPSSPLLDPVRWSVEATPTGANSYNLVFTAELDDKWTLYSQHTDAEGPTPTAFRFEGQGYQRQGEVTEAGDKKEGIDPFFGVNVSKFVRGPVRFTQRITLTDPAAVVSGVLEYMTCDDEQCLPTTEVAFSLHFGDGIATIGEAGLPMLGAGSPTAEVPGADPYGLSRASLQAPVGECGSVTELATASTSFWRIFILGFLGGLVALLTPCVFPMIPLTVSFFTKSAGNRTKGIRDATLYGGFILLVYLLLSVPFHLMDTLNPDILNDISTNVWLNVAFFVIFLVFAFSFFGYYELTLPASWTNRASSAEGVGGIVGIFFMALTLALVSFSCTGPILGSLLAGALTADGGAAQLTTGMGGFGLALALPFALFAAFPGMMKSLPKSGGWLNSVKVVLGFLELALALKFLSNADMVKHWGILRIEPFLILWMLIGLGLALYLFGVIKFPHDSPLKKLSPVRIGLGVLSAAFVIYLALGFRINPRSGAYESLSLLSGLAPPVCYSFFNPCDCPQGLECFKDLEAGLAYAREKNKPVMLDFTGYACVNCRKMEEHVWPLDPVLPFLRDDYVLISLYVDDKKELPTDQQIEVLQSHNGRTRKLRTYGNKWSHFQTEYFQINSQPYYVLLSPDGNTLLNQPVGYTPDETEYADFLRCGLDNFRRLSETRHGEGAEQPSQSQEF